MSDAVAIIGPEDTFDTPVPESAFPHLDNVVSSFQLKIDVNLRKLAFRARNAEYNPRKINAVVIRFRGPRSTAMVYSNGRVLISGSRSEDEARKNAIRIAKIVYKCDHPGARFANFRVENMVASANCGFPVRLEELLEEHRAHASYEPELFAGLVYRLLDPKLSILVFVSGKVVISGAKDRLDIRRAFKSIYPVLYKYRK